jgi:hypothetical protein
VNLTVSTLKATITNPSIPQSRKADALIQLRDLAGNKSDPRSKDAALALREVRGDDTCTENGQAGTIPESVDKELEEYVLGRVPENPSPLAESYASALGAMKLTPFPEQEPSVLARLKKLHQESQSRAVKERAFRYIVWLSEFGENPRATKTAKTYVTQFNRDQQVLESGGIRSLPDPLLLDFARNCSDPLKSSDPWILEAARRARLYPRSLGRRILHPDLLNIPFADLGTAKSGSDCESVFELTILYGCPEHEATMPDAVTA